MPRPVRGPQRGAEPIEGRFYHVHEHVIYPVRARPGELILRDHRTPMGELAVLRRTAAGELHLVREYPADDREAFAQLEQQGVITFLSFLSLQPFQPHGFIALLKDHGRIA